MTRTLSGASAFALALLTLAAPGLTAETASPPSMIVDVSPFAEFAAEFSIALLGLLAAAALDRLRRWLKVEETSRANALLHAALDRIVEGAIATAKAEVGRADLSVDVRSRAAARAIGAATERLPELLRQTGASPGKLAAIVADKLNVAAAKG